MTQDTFAAFQGVQLLRRGALDSVLAAVKDAAAAGMAEPGILIFDESSGRQVDFDLRGTLSEIVERANAQLAAKPAAGRASASPAGKLPCFRVIGTGWKSSAGERPPAFAGSWKTRSGRMLIRRLPWTQSTGRCPRSPGTGRISKKPRACSMPVSAMRFLKPCVPGRMKSGTIS